VGRSRLFVNCSVVAAFDEAVGSNANQDDIEGIPPREQAVRQANRA
jgi:hypothetical protein